MSDTRPGIIQQIENTEKMAGKGMLSIVIEDDKACVANARKQCFKKCSAFGGSRITEHIKNIGQCSHGADAVKKARALSLPRSHSRINADIYDRAPCSFQP